MPRKDRAPLALAVLASAAVAHADDITWINAAGGDWFNQYNWAPAVVPGENDRAVFNLPGTYTVTVGASAAKPALVGSIAVAAGNPTLNLAGARLRVAETAEFTHAAAPPPTLTVTNGIFEPALIAGNPTNRALLIAQGARLGDGEKYAVAGVDIVLDNGEWNGLLAAADSTITVPPGSAVSGFQFGGDILGPGATLLVLGGAASFDSLTVSAGAHLEVAANGFANAGYAFEGDGTLLVRDGGFLRVETGGGLAVNTITGPDAVAENITQGYAEISAGAQVYNDGGNLFAGQALITGPGSRLTTFWIDGDALVTDGAELAAFGSLDITGVVTLDGQGSPGAAVTGEIWLGGALEIRSGASVVTPILHMLQNAALSGDGLVVGEVEHEAGTIAPGPDAATLTINGGLSQTSPDAAIQVFLSPSGADLLAPEAAFLQGSLEVALADGYTPHVGKVFPILSASAVTGQFNAAAITWPALPPTRALVLDYSASGVSIRTTGCAADHNGDGTLSLADFTHFRSAYLATSPTADINGDGRLNTADLTAFRAAYLAGCP